jgi:hypothetical protein
MDGPLDWTFPGQSNDINGNGSVEPLDALIIINELNDPQFSDPATGKLVDPTLSEFPGYCLDSSPNGFVVALDSLVVINILNEQNGSGEGEATSGISPPEERGVGAASRDTTWQPSALQIALPQPPKGAETAPSQAGTSTESAVGYLSSNILRRQVVADDDLFADLDWVVELTGLDL